MGAPQPVFQLSGVCAFTVLPWLLLPLAAFVPDHLSLIVDRCNQISVTEPAALRQLAPSIGRIHAGCLQQVTDNFPFWC
jgi:uncharacterized membrane protein YhaH (DUF805 family)